MIDTPQSQYQVFIQSGKILPDGSQADVILHFERLFNEIISQRCWHQWLNKFKTYLHLKIHSPKGIYLWGGVGGGKTWLMDLFYTTLPLKNKNRLHFHHFMKQIHQLLKINEGRKNPIAYIAKQLSQQIKILCLDELFVEDIADAMILSELFTGLLMEGVILVITSNRKPDDLYLNGLQRDKFLPFIELLKNYNEVIKLENLEDYRLRHLSQHSRYYFGEDGFNQLKNCFHQLVPQVASNEPILINDRKISIYAQGNSVLWIGFKDLCEGHRSTQDYMELASYFHTIFLSDVELSDERINAVRRFIALIDELYEKKIMIIINAFKPLEALYEGTQLVFEFERTLSRLQEMQSIEYFE